MEELYMDNERLHSNNRTQFGCDCVDNHPGLCQEDFMYECALYTAHKFEQTAIILKQ